MKYKVKKGSKLGLKIERFLEKLESVRVKNAEFVKSVGSVMATQSGKFIYGDMEVFFFDEIPDPKEWKFIESLDGYKPKLGSRTQEIVQGLPVMSRLQLNKMFGFSDPLKSPSLIKDDPEFYLLDFHITWDYESKNPEMIEILNSEYKRRINVRS